MLPIKTILCPTDFSKPSLAALQTACELAEHFNAQLRLLHVILFTPPFPSDMIVVAAPNFYPSDRERFDEAQAAVEKLIAEHVPTGVHVTPEVRMGHVAHEIVCAADDSGADIIVIGTHGATGWRHLAFGSVTEKVVQMAHRPVLTVHGGPERARLRETEESTPEPEIPAII